MGLKHISCAIVDTLSATYSAYIDGNISSTGHYNNLYTPTVSPSAYFAITQNSDGLVDSIGGECLSDHDGTYLYIGKSPKNSLQTDPVWTIYRQLFSGTTSITTTSATNVAWSNRLEETYI